MVDDNIRTFENMKSHAKAVKQALNLLFEVKQKQANVWEARFARQAASETARQGNTLLVFTVVTIIFLPLSFLASFLTLNIAQFPRTEDGTGTLWELGGVSAYLFGIGIAVAVPFIVFAFNINWIQKIWRALFEKVWSVLLKTWTILPKAWRDSILEKKAKRGKKKIRRRIRKFKKAKDEYEKQSKEIHQLESTTEDATSDSDIGDKSRDKPGFKNKLAVPDKLFSRFVSGQARFEKEVTVPEKPSDEAEDKLYS